MCCAVKLVNMVDFKLGRLVVNSLYVEFKIKIWQWFEHHGSKVWSYLVLGIGCKFMLMRYLVIESIT